jgi:hypothetical protein
MIRTGAGLLAAISLVGVAQAEQLKPIEARSIELGGTVGVAYYTKADDGFRVVATLAAGEAATPVRFIATLTPGQSVVVSVPQALNEPAREVEIRRNGDGVTVSDFPSGQQTAVKAKQLPLTR